MQIRSLMFLVAATALVTGQAAATDRMLQRAGQVVTHSAPGNIVRAPASWADIPATKAAVTLPKGGELVATLTMETAIVYYGTNKPDILVRMVVDDTVVAGTDIRFTAGRSGYRTIARDFIGGTVSPGQHRVRFQWLARPGDATAIARQRTMVLKFASPDSPDFKLIGLQSGSIGSSTAIGWTDVTKLATTVTVPWDATLVIRYSGDAFTVTNTGDVWVRPLVDNQQVANTILTRCSIGGAQAHAYITRVSKGTHAIRMQWQATAGGTIYRPMIVIEAYPASGSRSATVAGSLVEGGLIERNASSFATLPGTGTGAIVTHSRGDLEVRLSLNARVPQNSRMQLRCVVDGNFVGQPVDISEALDDPNRQVESHTATWVVRNVDPGIHAVRIDWSAASGRVFLGDRSLVLSSVQGQSPLLVTALESTRPANYKYGGLFASTVVDVNGGKRVFKRYVGDMFWRSQPGVADWFCENSDAGLFVVEAGIAGPFLKQYDEQTYRGLSSPFTKMKIEALQKADATFDYSYYDRNGDSKVTTDELGALVVMYQDTNFGEVRPDVNNVATGDGVTLDFSAGLATVYTPDFKQRWEIGVMDHELSHLLISAGDMYENSDPSAPGPFSIMDQHGWNGHLDPLHKWKAGKFYDPEIPSRDGYVTLEPIADRARFLMLRDVRSHNGEYFLVENRGTASYDASLPASGLAVWHCDQTRLTNWRTAVEIEPAGGAANNYRYDTYLFRGTDPGFAPSKDLWDDSTHTNTRWHDNARSGIGLWAIERVAGSAAIRAFVDVPGPGALAQWEYRRRDIGAGGKFQARLRVVNTDSVADSMVVTLTGAAKLSWTRQSLTLQPYEQRILTVDVTPSSFAQTITADIAGARGGASRDAMQLAGSCRSISSVTPASLPNLTHGVFDVTLNAPGEIQAVTIGANVVASRDSNDWSNGFYELLNAGRLVRVHPPQGIAPGSLPLQVRFPLCTTNAVTVKLTRITTRLLATNQQLTAGRLQTVWVSKGTMPTGTVGILTISGSATPSVIPGLVRLDLGNSFQELLVLPGLVIDPITNTVPWSFRVPQQLSGRRLYTQAVVIDPSKLQLLTTNLSFCDYR